jgi:hypothetical protein
MAYGEMEHVFEKYCVHENKEEKEISSLFVASNSAFLCCIHQAIQTSIDKFINPSLLPNNPPQ